MLGGGRAAAVAAGSRGAGESVSRTCSALRPLGLEMAPPRC